MKVFVTGITGFAGVHLAEHLIASGDDVIGCSHRGRWPRHAPGELLGRVPMFVWDIRLPPPDDVRTAIARFAPESIVHLASLSIPADCGADEPTADARATNVEGTRQVAELAAQLPSKPRVLLASSSYVYRPVERACQTVDESWPANPRGGYGKTKLGAEHVLRDRATEAGFDWIAARLFQHTGPGQGPRMMLPEWTRQFTRSESEPIRVRTFDSYLDLCDVRDVVRAYRFLLERGRSGLVYNVGSGRCRRSADVFQMLRNRYDPGRKAIETSPGTWLHPIADLTRITGDTGWQPSIPLEKTIDDTIKYWQAETP